MKKLLFTLFSCWMFFSSPAQVGSPDSSFGTHGIKPLAEPMDMTGFERLQSFPADEGGRFDIYGITYFTDGPLFIAKYLKDGSLDVTYGNDGISEGVTMTLRSAVRQQDGRITVAGIVENEYGTPHYDLVMIRFSTEGTVDHTTKVGNTGSQYEDLVSLTVQSDKVVLSGVSASVWTGTYYFVRILYPDGAVQEKSSGTFHNASFDYQEENNYYSYEGIEDAFAKGYKVALEGDKIVLEGPLGYIHSEYSEDNLVFHHYTIEYAAARFNSDGSRDTAFGENGAMPVGQYVFPAITDTYTPKSVSTKKVVLAQVLNNNTGNQDFSITVYKEDETLDENFGNRGRVTLDFGGDDSPATYIWQGNDLIVGGITTQPNGRSAGLALARLNSNGTLDPAFNKTGKQVISDAEIVFSLQRFKLQKKGAENTLLAIGEDAITAIILEDDARLACLPDKEAPVLAGGANAVVTGMDPVLSPATGNVVASYSLSGATVGTGAGTVSGIRFNKGITTVRYKLAGLSTQTCSFTVTVYDPAAWLPIDLVTFEGRLLSTGAVELTWKPATEENSAYFSVERSDDKGQFTEIGTQPANGNGSTYAFQDTQPMAGINTYRIRQVNGDGNYKYSTTLSVYVLTRNGITLSPNPSSGFVTVITKMPATEKQLVQVFTVSGSPVYSRQHAGNQFPLDLSSLPNGIYILRVGNEQARILIAK